MTAALAFGFSACGGGNKAPSITLVTIPAGSFEMGCSNNKNCIWTEKPVHTVHLKTFKLATTETTWAQYQPCINAGVCPAPPQDSSPQQANHPLNFVNQNDINTYIKWLNKATDKQYRLPSEAEWEYAARAGSNTIYSWGNTANCTNAHYNGGETSACNHPPNATPAKGTLPVASFAPNAFGLYDMHGNVREWMQDCWNNSYAEAPNDGSAWMSGKCYKVILRGGAWALDASQMRAAYRHRGLALARTNMDGFRLAQSIDTTTSH